MKDNLVIYHYGEITNEEIFKNFKPIDGNIDNIQIKGIKQEELNYLKSKYSKFFIVSVSHYKTSLEDLYEAYKIMIRNMGSKIIVACDIDKKEAPKSFISIEGCSFESKLSFKQCIFQDKVRFSNISFHSETIFSENTFEEEVDFSGSIFYNKADLSSSKFKKDISFKNTKFLGEHNSLFKISLEGKVDFSNALVKEYINFSGCTFKEEANFYNFRSKEASFTETNFEDRFNFIGIWGDFSFDNIKLNDKEISTKTMEYYF